MTALLTVQVPFDGFYESSHSQLFDDYIEQEVEYLKEDHNATDAQLDALEKAFHWETNFKGAYIRYAEKYVSQIEDLIDTESDHKLSLTFEDMDSPKYYNFETDRIFAKMSIADVQIMFDAVSTKDLDEAINARFSSRDGFISSYPNRLAEWPSDVRTWDHNQLGVLLEVFLATILEKDDIAEDLKSWTLMEKLLGNGFIDNLIYETSSENYKKLFNEITGVKSPDTNQMELGV